MSDKTEKTFTEEIEVAGGKLVDRVKELVAEGQVRRLRLKGSDGVPMLDIPLNVGAIAGGAVALAAPWLALIAAFAALVGHATIEVVRVDEEKKSDDKAAPAKEPADASVDI